MDTLRYYVALIALVVAPPMFCIWLVVHPLVRFWRRLGPGWTYALVGSLAGIAMAGLFQAREPLLAVEFGTRYPLVGLGLLCLVGAAAIESRCRQQLTLRMLVGLPELAPKRYPGTLLTDGIYARIRHPRYAGGVLGLVGYALLANYLATYAIVPICLAAIYSVAVLEERELRDRFGPAYDEYARRVPRFVPRIGSAT
jgi:protein-S-isoprenylcysteine O-methyltransferase Ste14